MGKPRYRHTVNASVPIQVTDISIKIYTLPNNFFTVTDTAFKSKFF